MFSTIRVKIATVCKRCGGAIPIGTKIRYGGRGRAYHMAAECPAASGRTVAAAARHARYEGVSSTNEEELAAQYVNPHGVSNYTRFSSGAEVYTNKNGRCEDAPCCGCCS
jgi:hypothetical protein